jgi:rhodanese-related sulfurtransferase
VRPPGARTVEEILAEARARLDRLDPAATLAAQRDGAVLVDIRPAAQRAATGVIPGSVVVERNRLGWRFDPASDARLPVADYELRVIVICQEGYSSSLAAAALQDLGRPPGHRPHRRHRRLAVRRPPAGAPRVAAARVSDPGSWRRRSAGG